MAFILFVGLSSCDDNKGDEPKGDIIWDIGPLNIDVKVVDGSGNNLLDAYAAGNWVGQPFVMTYKGESYEVVWPEPDVIGDASNGIHGRAYMPHFDGLKAIIENYWDVDHRVFVDGKFYLSFGEFSGDDNHDLSMQLSVPGLDEVYNIDVTHRFGWDDGKPVIATTIKLNGEIVEKFPIEIVLPRL